VLNQNFHGGYTISTMSDRAQFSAHMREEIARAKQQQRKAEQAGPSMGFLVGGMLGVGLVTLLAGSLWGLIFATMVMSRLFKR
jgi:hypothetical protein